MEKTVEQKVTLTQVSKDVTSILQLLRGHEMDKDDKGMVGMQYDHEFRLGKIEKFISNARYFLLGIAFPAGWGLIDIITKIFVK